MGVEPILEWTMTKGLSLPTLPVCPHERILNYKGLPTTLEFLYNGTQKRSRTFIAFQHSPCLRRGRLPVSPSGRVFLIGADDKNRTCDLLIKSQLLCLLSYIRMVSKMGLEPIRLSATVSKTAVSTIPATWRYDIWWGG